MREQRMVCVSKGTRHLDGSAQIAVHSLDAAAQGFTTGGHEGLLHHTYAD